MNQEALRSESIAFKTIVKGVVEKFDFADPSHESFDEGRFWSELTTIEQTIGSKNISNISEGTEAIEALLTINELLRSARARISTLILEINQPRHKLVEYLLGQMNLQVLSAIEGVHVSFYGENSGAVNEISDAADTKLKTIFGGTVRASDAVDQTTDVTTRLIQFISEAKSPDEPIETSDNNTFAKIQEMIMICNVLVNVESAVKYYRHEFADLKVDADKVHVKHVPSFYYFARIAGRARENNHLHEFILRDFETNGGDIGKDSHAVVKNGELLLDGLTGSTALERSGSSAVLQNYFVHVAETVVPTFRKLRVRQIARFLAEVRHLFHLLPISEILDKTQREQRLSNVPVKLDRRKLVKSISHKAEITNSECDRLISLLTTELKSDISLWRTPFLKIDDEIYFAIAPLYSGHIAYLIDCILKLCFDDGKSQRLFFKSFKETVFKTKTKDYLFRLLDATTLPGSMAEFELEVLVVRMKSTLLLLAPVCFPYPLESVEYGAAINALGEKSKVLSNALQTLAKETRVLSDWVVNDCIGLLVANYPVLSGVNCNGFQVIDCQLYGNYFSVGKYLKGALASGFGFIQSRAISSITYYDNEDEFNSALKGFVLRPPPVFAEVRNLEIKEYSAVFPETTPVILRDGVEKRSLRDSIESDIAEVKSLLQQLYYFESDLKNAPDSNSKTILEALGYLGPVVTSFIAMNRTDAALRFELLKAFRDGGVYGLGYLFTSLHRYLSEIPTIQLTELNEQPDDFNSDVGRDLFDKMLEENFGRSHSSGQVNLFEYEFKHELSPRDIKDVLAYIRNLVAAAIPRAYSEQELEDLYFIVGVYASLSSKLEFEEKNLHTALVNFVEVLNYNGYYQRARNFSETVIQFAFNRGNSSVIGWLVAFKCYTKQSNVLDAAFYGNLYFASLLTSPIVSEDQFYDSLYNAMLFFRDYGFTDTAETIFRVLEKMKMGEYDQQKVFLSYHSSKLLDPEKLHQSLPEVHHFLSGNIESILRFGQAAALPWIAFIYNIANIRAKIELKTSFSFDELLGRLESAVDQGTLKNLKSSFFAQGDATKEKFKNSLVKVFETKFFEDFASELGNLELISKNNALLSIDPIDINSLLRSGLVLNDNRLTFRSSKGNEKLTPFAIRADQDVALFLESYGTQIVNCLDIRKGQLVCWHFSIYDRVFLLTIDHNKNVRLKRLTSWNLKRMSEWMSTISDFYFDAKGDYPIDEQEAGYLEVIKALGFARFDPDSHYDELLIAPSLELANFPHNLFIGDFIPHNSNHDSHFLDTLTKFGSDFISFSKPIANIVTLEWFAEHSSGNIDDLNVEAWIPVEDGDFVLSIGYEKLRPLIEKKLKGVIQTSTYPSKQLSSTINIFMAHGGKGIEGFRTIYTKSQEGHALIRDSGTAFLFGKGMIAILFVCNSASLSKEVYSQKLISLVHEILGIGYHAVVAPAWSLNPDITPVWLAEFIKCLADGKSLNRSVHSANVAVATVGFNEFHGYFYPAGWAAMHLYGNPNICYQTTQSQST